MIRRLVAVVLALWSVYSLFRVGVLHAAMYQWAQGVWPRAWSGSNLVLACWYVGGVLAIVGAHEWGHWQSARSYGLQTAGPFLIPLPLGWIPWLPAFGIGGAWLWRKSPFPSPQARWDVAYTGLMTGAIATIGCLLLGSWLSRGTVTMPQANFWRPVVMDWIAPHAWHPLVTASWFGWCLTTVSLIPIPPCDGYHLLRAWPDVSTVRKKALATVMGLAFVCWL